MLSDAVMAIRQSVASDELRRRQRLEQRADLRRAEEYLWVIEEMLEVGRTSIPEPLAVEIARFVRPYSRKLARFARMGSTEGEAGRTLDALFDVQERIQRRQAQLLVEGAPAATG